MVFSKDVVVSKLVLESVGAMRVVQHRNAQPAIDSELLSRSDFLMISEG